MREQFFKFFRMFDVVFLLVFTDSAVTFFLRQSLLSLQPFRTDIRVLCEIRSTLRQVLRFEGAQCWAIRNN